MSGPSTLNLQLSTCARPRARAFTLIELLTVIAIIGLLAAILIPTVSSARNSAKKAKAKVVFSQWAVAMEQFKQEYGYYPQIDNGTGKVMTAFFAGALTGKKIDGSSASTAELAGNTKLISFYTISEGDLTEARDAIADAFGNVDIAVLYDKNSDGRITSEDGYTAKPVVSFLTSKDFTPPPDTETGLNLDPKIGVRAPVIFYSAGKGDIVADLVLSWK